MSLFADIDYDERSKIAWQPPSELPNLAAASELVVDFETTGLKWWAGSKPIGVAVGIPGGPSWYLPFGHRGGGNLSEEAVKRWFVDQVRGKNLIGHNAKFDNHMAYSGWNVDLEALGCRWWDTQHCLALLDDHRHRFDLDTVAREFLGGDGKKKLTAFTKLTIDASHMADYHAGEIAEYGCEDVDLTGKLWRLFMTRIEAEELDRVLDLESRLIYPVCEMERNPCRLDVEKLTRWERETLADLEGVLLEINRATNLNLNPNSSSDWKQLFERRGLEPPTKLRQATKAEKNRGDFKMKRVVTFEAEALRPIQDPVIQLGLKAKQLESLRSKYICAYLKHREGDYIRTALHQLKADEGGTISGRFSSSSYDVNGETIGYNGQQVFAVEKQQANFGDKYIIRELFIPEPGKKWLSEDAEQIEYRLFAHYVNSDRINALYMANPKAKFHDEVWKMLKQFKPDILYKHTKNINFARIYGAGPNKLAAMLGLSPAETQRVLKIYNEDVLPEAPGLIRLASETARRRGYVKTLFGRRARFPNAWRLYKALNSIIQGSAGDIMKLKLIEAYEERKRIGLTMKLTVHDELDGDVENDESRELTEEVLNRQTTELRVPILWSGATSQHWAACDSKWMGHQAA